MHSLRSTSSSGMKRESQQMADKASGAIAAAVATWDSDY